MEDTASRYARLDKYGSGLLTVRRVIAGVSPESVEFHPVMGKLRGLLDTAAAVVQEKEKARMELESVAMEAVSLSYLLRKRGHAGPM